MEKSRRPLPGFGSPRRTSSISGANTPTKRSPLSWLEQASPKRKRHDRSGPTTKGYPSEDGSRASHSDIDHTEQNFRAGKKSEIVDGTKDEQTERSDIDETAATKRQKSKNYRGLKVIRVGTRAASLQETVRLCLEDNTRDPASIAYSYTHPLGAKEIRLVLDYY